MVFLGLALMPLVFQKEFLIQNSNRRRRQPNETFTDLGEIEHRLQCFEATLCQQQHAPARGWDSDTLTLYDFRFISTKSFCFVEESVSIPGNGLSTYLVHQRIYNYVIFLLELLWWNCMLRTICFPPKIMLGIMLMQHMWVVRHSFYFCLSFTRILNKIVTYLLMIL